MGSCISKDEKRNLNCKNGLLNNSNLNNLSNTNRDLFRSENSTDQRPLNLYMPNNKLTNNNPSSSNHRLNNSSNNELSNRLNSNLSNHRNSKTVVALFPYTSKDEGDLSFVRGDQLIILAEKGPDWCFAKLIRTNKEGFIPKNYVAAHPLETEE